MTDAQLLRDFALAGSQPAFAEIVQRHVHLVHASALRQVRGDAHLADDITQAVFMVLARRARSLGSEVVLTGWLINTTRYAALSTLKLQSRRRFHEQRAAAMVPQQSASAADPDMQDKLNAALDAALSRLRAADRSAIALRYLQGKPVSEVGEAMGISQHAAQKRIGRALQRLRDVLARHGVATPADILEGNLAAMSLHLAPAALVSAIASAGGAGASASTIAAATIKALLAAKAKVIASAVAASVLIIGAATPIILNTPVASQAVAAAPSVPTSAGSAPSPTAPPATSAAAPAAVDAPLKLPNITFFQNYNAKEFTAGIDTETIRVPGGEPAAILASDTPRWGDGGSSLRSIDATPFHGKRIRFSAFVKSQDLANWGGLWIFATDRGNHIYAADDNCEGSLRRTTDWKRMELVCDIPPECEIIRCGLSLRGKGKLWLDSPQIEVVPDTVPITDDQNWHAWSFSMPHYSTRMDESTKRNGHATRLLTSQVAAGGEWLSWDRNDRHPEKYLGKKMKVSMWIKTENVTGASGLLLDVRGPNFQSIIPGLSKDQRTIRGTTEWTRYQFTAEIPPETQNICTGVRLGGKGKLWLDDVQYQLIE